MSHFTKLKTKISSKEYLKKALKRMGFEYEEGSFNVSQYGTTEKAEILLDQAVGFSLQEDGTWSMVGDFYHAKQQSLRKFYSKNQQFTDELTTAYTVEEVKSNLEAQNFFCSQNADAQVGADNMITMVFESYT